MNLLYIKWDPSIGIDLGFYTIRYYSLMFVLAFSLGLFLMKKIYLKDGVSLEKLDSLFIYVVIATIFGARIGHFLFYDPEFLFRKPLEVILPFQFSPKFRFTGFQGLASHGAAIGIISALYFYSKKVIDKPFLWILDRVGIVVALAGFFIRIGNLLNSEIIGKATGTDFGFVFVKLGEDFPRHPTQIYEAVGYLLVFILLWYLYWKTKAKEHLGFLFGLFFALLWSVRFFIEFFKEAQVDERATWSLNTGQWLSIPLVLIGIYFIYKSKMKNN